MNHIVEKIGALVAALLKAVFPTWKSQRKRRVTEKNPDQEQRSEKLEASSQSQEDRPADRTSQTDEAKAPEIHTATAIIAPETSHVRDQKIDAGVTQPRAALAQNPSLVDAVCGEEAAQQGTAALGADASHRDTVESRITMCETALAGHEQMRAEEDTTADATDIQQGLPPEIQESLPAADTVQPEEPAEMREALRVVGQGSEANRQQHAAELQTSIAGGSPKSGVEDGTSEYVTELESAALVAPPVTLHVEESHHPDEEIAVAVEESKEHKSEEPGNESALRLGKRAPPVPLTQKGVTGSAKSSAVAHQDAAAETEWDGFSERAHVGSPVAREPRPPTSIEHDDELSRADRAIDTELKPAAEHQKKAPEPIDISEYQGPGTEWGAIPLPEAYLRWNKILFTRFIAVAAQARVHLAVSPRSLSAALSSDTGERLAPPEAERQFVEAVKAAYHSHVVGSSARLRILRRCNPTDGVPLCVGFLALSVLAAHKMHTDQGASSSAYYIRLASLLDVEKLAGNLPKDFRTEEFASLWGFLADWVARNKGLSLVLPEEDVQRRYIAYPLAHVPLRQLDLDKLPAFFDWAGYSPDAAVSTERVADDLQRWEQSYGLLSAAGNSALLDDRLPAVVAQIRSELRAWNGLVADAHGIRHAQVEVLLEPVGWRWRLFFLAPRGEGYPQVFRSDEIELSGSGSWYDPLELGVDNGHLLLHGFSWPSEDDMSCVLRRPGATAIVLAPNAEYSGFVSRSQIPKDTQCAVICHEKLVDTVAAYLTSICESPSRAIQESGFPREWWLFPQVRAIRLPDSVPSELRSLNVASEADIIPQGGLRLGSQSAWMEGAPPRMLIEGHEGRPVYVDDDPVELDAEGFLIGSGLFSKGGTYTVRVGSLEKKVRIVRPALRPSAVLARPAVEDRARRRHPVILPLGAWVLVGHHPSQVLPIKAEGPRKSLVFCDFEPAWAIEVGAGRGATVIQISMLPAVHCRKLSKSPNALRWVSAIYEAAIRRPALESQVDNSAHATRTWTAYVEQAKQLKRHWKKKKGTP